MLDARPWPRARRRGQSFVVASGRAVAGPRGPRAPPGLACGCDDVVVGLQGPAARCRTGRSPGRWRGRPGRGVEGGPECRRTSTDRAASTSGSARRPRCLRHVGHRVDAETEPFHQVAPDRVRTRTPASDASGAPSGDDNVTRSSIGGASGRPRRRQEDERERDHSALRVREQVVPAPGALGLRRPATGSRGGRGPTPSTVVRVDVVVVVAPGAIREASHLTFVVPEVGRGAVEGARVAVDAPTSITRSPEPPVPSA